MFSIWARGREIPYWGEVSRVEAIEALQDSKQSKQQGRYRVLEDDKEDERITHVKNYRFFKPENEIVIQEEEKEHEEEILALQIMSFPVITLYEDDTLEEAWGLFKKSRFHHIPVISRQGKLVGILSERTIFHELYLFGGDKKIVDVMKKDVFTSKSNTPIKKIAQLFVIERIGSMPIVDNAGNLIGIITRSDILRTFSHLYLKY